MTKLWHEEVGKEFRERFTKSQFNLEDHIGSHYLGTTMDQLAMWPFLEKVVLHFEATQRLLSKPDQTRISDLELTAMNFMFGSIRRELTSANEEGPNYRFKVITPEDEDYHHQGLEKVPTCVKKKSRDRIVKKHIEDISNGGTSIFFLERDGTPVVYNRLFLSVDSQDREVLFYDTIENGNHKANCISHWEEEGRLRELLLCVAFSTYMADELGVSYVALADRELSEVGTLLGGPKRVSLPREEPKVGIPALHRNRNPEHVYQSRLYKESNRMFRVLDPWKMKKRDRLFEEFMRVYSALEDKGFDRPQKRFDQNANYALCLGSTLMRTDIPSGLRNYIEKKTRTLLLKIDH